MRKPRPSFWEGYWRDHTGRKIGRVRQYEYPLIWHYYTKCRAAERASMSGPLGPRP